MMQVDASEPLKQFKGQLAHCPLLTNCPGAQAVHVLISEQVTQRGEQGRQVESVVLR